MFRKLFRREDREKAVFDEIHKHLNLLKQECDELKDLMISGNRELIESIEDIEREGDIIRRSILSKLFEGAFMPFLSSYIYRFVEISDEVMDTVEDVARCYELISLPEELKEDVISIADMNCQISELLTITFQAFTRGEDIREKVLAIRVYEKRIDDIDHNIRTNTVNIQIDNFWKGLWLSEFLRSLASISDLIEDAADVLSLIHISLR